jgi:hypothetical protein
MWRLLILVSVCASLWGASLLLPVSDGERQLRSIVSIAVQQPADGSATILAPTGRTADTLDTGGDSLTIPLNRAYLPEGAAAVDVKALVGSKPMRPAKSQGSPGDANKAAAKAIQPLMATGSVPAPTPAKRPVGSALANAKPVTNPQSDVAAVAVRRLPLAAPSTKPVSAAVPAPVAARRIPPLLGVAVKAQQTVASADVPAPLQVTQVPAALEQTSHTVTLAVAEPPKNSAEGKARRGLTRALQRELVRIGCLDVGVTGDWDDATRSAMKRLNSAMGGTLPTEGPDSLALSAAQQHQGNCGASGNTVLIAVKAPPKPALKPAKEPVIEKLAAPAQDIAENGAVSVPVKKPTVVAELAEKPVTQTLPEMLPEQPTLAVDPAPQVAPRLILKRPPLPQVPAVTVNVDQSSDETGDTVAKRKRPTKRLFVAPRRPVARPDPRPVKVAVLRPVREPSRSLQRSARANARADVRALAARTEVRAKQRRQTVLAARKPRKRPLLVARRYPSYQMLQASLFRPFVVLRRTRFERVRTIRRARPLRAWEFGNGIPGLPKYLR